MNVFARNIQVWNETKSIVTRNNLIAPISVKFKDIKTELHAITKTTDINVIDMDTIDAGIILKERKFKPVVLNMCDWYVPGGVVEAGATTQEEDLFRRSNYFTTLDKKFYPLYNNETIYSKSVFVFRDNADNNYNILNTPVFLDFIAAPAPFKPVLEDKRIKKQEDIDLFKNKMETLFEVAYSMGNDSIVLSAWGCGAFHCPPEHTAELFNEVIAKYRKAFRIIVFAILNKNKNYKVFKKLITQ